MLRARIRRRRGSGMPSEQVTPNDWRELDRPSNFAGRGNSAMEHERTEKNGVRIRWTGRTLGVLGVCFAGVITLVSSFTSFVVTHYLDEATVTQKQNDRLDNLDQRLTKLEAIAQTNTEARI